MAGVFSEVGRDHGHETRRGRILFVYYSLLFFYTFFGPTSFRSISEG